MPRHAASLTDILAGSKSASFRRLNAHLFAGAAGPMGGLPCPVAKPNRRHADAGEDRREVEGQAGVAGGGRARNGHGTRRAARSSPGVRVHLCSLRRPGRPLDRDNLVGGCKAARDQIARWLGLDDNEAFIEWEYSQHETRGRRGLIVTIELLRE